MKTQLRKPAHDRARYSEEYKKEALELWRLAVASIIAAASTICHSFTIWTSSSRSADSSDITGPVPGA